MTRHSLLFRDGLVAAVTHSHLKLKAHEGDGGALGGALPAHRLPALPTVVLEPREKDEGLLLPSSGHGTEPHLHIKINTSGPG